MLIQQLFSKGQSFQEGPFRFHYITGTGLIPAESPVRIQAGFSVPKRLHRRAVVRNSIRRKMKEAYRKIYRSLFYSAPEYNPVLVLIVYTGKKEADYASMESSIHTGLQILWGKSLPKS